MAQVRDSHSHSQPLPTPPSRFVGIDLTPTSTNNACMSVTNAGHHVENTITLLQNAPTGDWTTTPEVYKYWDHAQSERGPGADMPPYLYVWSPTTTSLDRFSMDGDHFLEGNNVEVQVWSLDETECRQTQADVTQILSQYLDDNATDTPYSDVAPVGENDYREQKPARTTDHYVMSVELETTGLSDTSKNA